jgi:hypothetical protein
MSSDLKFYAYSKDKFAPKLEVYGSSCTYTNTLPIWHMIEAQDVSLNFGITLPLLSAENQIHQNQDQDPILMSKMLLPRNKNSAIVNTHDA